MRTHLILSALKETEWAHSQISYNFKIQFFTCLHTLHFGFKKYTLCVETCHVEHSFM